VLVSLFAIAVFLSVFGLVAREVNAGKPLTFDRYLMRALRSSAEPAAPIGPAWLQEAARDMTSLGSVTVLVFITFAVAGYLFLGHKPEVACLMLIAVLGGLALNSLLKLAFARPRPDFVIRAPRVFSTSFPSGHAALSAMTYLTIGAILARAYPSSTTSLYFMSLAIFLTLLIGISRIYLGVHYPTDIFGGWCLGAAWAIACWVLMALL
jgi:undecaprenyl-diphosphatase